MILSILQVGEAVLRQPARALTVDEIQSAAIQQLIEAMRDTMRYAPGVGLAAPQIGVPLQLAVIEDREETMRDLPADLLAERERQPVPFHVIINPKITLSPDTVEFFEGCQSLERFGAVVPRSRRVVVECLNERAEPQRIAGTGWYARILQHETDHLKGYLYTDRMRRRTFMSLDNYNRYWRQASMQEVVEAMGEDV
jgi:peptide deformylase